MYFFSNARSLLSYQLENQRKHFFKNILLKLTGIDRMTQRSIYFKTLDSKLAIVTYILY